MSGYQGGGGSWRSRDTQEGGSGNRGGRGGNRGGRGGGDNQGTRGGGGSQGARGGGSSQGARGGGGGQGARGGGGGQGARGGGGGQGARGGGGGQGARGGGGGQGARGGDDNRGGRGGGDNQGRRGNFGGDRGGRGNSGGNQDRRGGPMLFGHGSQGTRNARGQGNVQGRSYGASSMSSPRRQEWGAGGGRAGQGGHGGQGRDVPGSSVVPRELDPNAPIPEPSAEVTRLEDQYISEQRQQQQPLEAVLASGVSKLSLGYSVDNSWADTTFPRRPGYGSQGREVTLWANYFEMKTDKSQFVRYIVTAKRILADDKKATTQDKSKRKGGEKDPTEVKGQLLRIAIEEVLKQLKQSPNSSVPIATEYRGQVVSLLPLRLPQGNVVRVAVPGFRTPLIIEVAFGTPVPISMDSLDGFLKSMVDPTDITDQGFPKFADSIDTLNVIMGHAPRSHHGTAVVGRGRFFPLLPASEQAVLEGSERMKLIIRGYFQSVRPATGRLLLNVNVTHGVLLQPGNIGYMLKEVGLNCMDRVETMSSTDRNKVFRRLTNISMLLTKVQTKMPLGKNLDAKKRILGLARRSKTGQVRGNHAPQYFNNLEFASPDKLRFWYDPQEAAGRQHGSPPTWTGEPIGLGYITVYEYQRQQWGRISDKTLPLVKIGEKDGGSFMPAEFVDIIPGQGLRGKLSAIEAQHMIKFACRKPRPNIESIVGRGRQVLQLDNNQLLNSFGISVDNALITVRGRVLSTPEIKYAGPKSVPASNGKWNMVGAKVLKSGPKLERWTWVHIKRVTDSKEIGDDELKRQINELQDKLISMGIDMKLKDTDSGGAVIPVYTKNVELKDMIDIISKTFSEPPPQLVFFVVPTAKDAEIYNAIKIVGDTKLGFHTICMVSDKLKGANAQYFANVGLKVNLKLGGRNHSLDKDLDIFSKGKTMFVGYDVIHPTNMGAGTEHLPSQVGLVSSVDRNLAQWPATSWTQNRRQEMLVDDEKTFVKKFRSRLDLWRGGELPQNIIIFRDGVSEGQFKQVIDVELPQIREACQETYKKKEVKTMPKLCIIVSIKRHNTRFYPTSNNNQDVTKSGNTRNGTVVDRGVTLARYWEFFLTAHETIQGTARPARYVVIHDEVFIPSNSATAADDVEKMIHEMCFLYGRATKAVSLCPPAYYADIVCTRARVHMSEIFDRSDIASQTTASTTTTNIPQCAVHPRLANTMYYI